MKINVIMPMLGRGTRMYGIQNTVKPLIEFPDKKPFFLKALESLSNYEIDTLVLVIPIDYQYGFMRHMDTLHKMKNVHNVIFCCCDYTVTPCETVLKGLSVKTNDLPIIVLDCDIYSVLPVYNKIKPDEAHLFTFTTTTKNKSYIAFDKNKVTDIKEKNPITDMAVFGAYMFGSKNLLQDKIDQCKYLSDVVKNCLPNVSFQQLKEHLEFGTAQEFKEALKEKKHALQSFSI